MEPLTEAEEARIRREYPDNGGAPTRASFVIRRLLATIDALRVRVGALEGSVERRQAAYDAADEECLQQRQRALAAEDRLATAEAERDEVRVLAWKGWGEANTAQARFESYADTLDGVIQDVYDRDEQIARLTDERDAARRGLEKARKGLDEMGPLLWSLEQTNPVLKAERDALQADLITAQAALGEARAARERAQTMLATKCACRLDDDRRTVAAPCLMHMDREATTRRDAFRRGQELMREKAARAAEAQASYPDTKIARRIRALPILDAEGEVGAKQAFPVDADVVLSDVARAFVDGAYEARNNPTATPLDFIRTADGYVKLILKRKADATLLDAEVGDES